MDLVGFDQAVFDKIVTDFYALLGKLGPLAVTAIPVCARDGDNVTAPSTRMPWYSGTTLLTALEGRRTHLARRRAGLPDAGAARGAPGPHVPRLCRHGGHRDHPSRRHGVERRLRRRGRGVAHRDDGWRPRQSGAGPGGDAGSGSRDRRLARRRAGCRAAAGAGRPGDRLGGLDGRDPAVPRPRLSRHARHPNRCRHGDRYRQPPRCRHARRSAGARAGAERDRPGDDLAGAARCPASDMRSAANWAASS